MFSLFKKKEGKSVKTDLSWLGADLHSHLLPGIDDGSPDMNTSLELIKEFVALGYNKIITTPHILWELYPNTPEIIAQKAAEVRAALAKENIDIDFKAAAEYFIDEHFEDELRNKKPLLTIKDNLVLVEFSMVMAPFDLKDVLFEMQMQGYQPLIAHPERYIYLRNRKEYFDELKEAGCQFQLNLLALTSYYGNTVQELADYLVKNELYSYAGTDLHSSKHLHFLQKIAAAPLYNVVKDSGLIKNNLL